jgi:hypothetical protein
LYSENDVRFLRQFKPGMAWVGCISQVRTIGKNSWALLSKRLN